MRCSSWSKKSVQYISASVRRVTAFLASSSIDVAAHQIRTAQSAGLYRETFRLQPLLQQADLRRAAGTVHAFDHDQGAGNFAGIETHQRFAQKMLRTVLLLRTTAGFAAAAAGGVPLGEPASAATGAGVFSFSLSFSWSGIYSASAARGAKRFKSILDATMSRICFCNLFTGKVPSSTTKLSDSTILS